MKHVANGIYIAIEQALEAEDDVPPVKRADNRKVEQSVVGNSLWELLDTSTIILTHANSHTEQQVIVYESIIDPHLNARRLIPKERTY